MSEKIFEAINISKDFIQGGICLEILKNFNLSVERSEIISIVGASGSGKSTFLQIGGLLDSKYNGDIILKAISTKELSQNQKTKMRLNDIGFVYQYHHLLKDFSARENIAMPAIIAGKNYHASCEKADDLLEELGMRMRRFHFPSQLSGGEQQRVAIARALFNDPSIIFADEPTGNLDPETAELVFNIFLKLAKQRGTATIIVTHNHELAKLTDRIVKIK